MRLAAAPPAPRRAGRALLRRAARGLAAALALALALALLPGPRPACAQLDNTTSPTSQFRSRPDLHAPIIDLSVFRPELVTPGYIFLAPYRNLDPGPYIYDSRGNLVWSGAGAGGPKTAHAPRVCTYRGRDHLCFFEGEQHQGFARGHGVIMDQNYRVVQTVESAGAGASSDMHEFKMTPYAHGTTVLMTVYQPRPYDLTTNPRFNVARGMGWVVEGVFQEVEIDTGRLVFEWRSLDHVDPGLSWTMPGTTDTSGDGLHEQSPWDYFHLNSVDKNADGDYLISARHVSAIYKLSGRDGRILWQMGGSAATLRTTNFVFSYQHHARWRSENATHSVVSLYDNASNTFNATGTFSHAWIVVIDHAAGTATMVQEWGAPEAAGGLLSGSQGNAQVLPDGGCHIGWGEHAYFSEHTADGTAVLYGKLAQRASNVMIYRSHKFNWTAQPLTKPALWTYSQYGETTAFFVSWNGATEVASWSFYTADGPNGPWTFAGNQPKTGFETEWHQPGLSLWAYAEALDAADRPLEASAIARAFVPSQPLARYCDARGCQHPEPAAEGVRTPYEAEIVVPQRYLSPHRGFNTSHYYEDLPDGVAHRPNWTGSHWGPDGASAANHSGSGSGGRWDAGTFLLAVGLLLGFGATTAGYVLWTRGAGRRYPRFLEPLADAICRRTGALSGSRTTRAFGSRLLGTYTRVGTPDDPDATDGGIEFGSSGRNSLVGSRFRAASLSGSGSSRFA